MQHSPTDAFVAGINAALLSLLGVPYHAMLWAFIGACVVVTQTQRMESRPRVIVYVLLSTLVGAMLGAGAADFLGVQSRPILAVLSCVAGVGWQSFIALLLKLAEGRIRSVIPPAQEPPQ